MMNATDINAPAAMRFFCPPQCGVSRHQSERGRRALLACSRYRSAEIGRGAERGVRPDAPRSAAGLQIQKRLALEAEFDPSPKHALGSHVFQSVSLPQSSLRISRARRLVSWTVQVLGRPPQTRSRLSDIATSGRTHPPGVLF